MAPARTPPEQDKADQNGNETLSTFGNRLLDYASSILKSQRDLQDQTKSWCNNREAGTVAHERGGGGAVELAQFNDAELYIWDTALPRRTCFYQLQDLRRCQTQETSMSSKLETTAKRGITHTPGLQEN